MKTKAVCPKCGADIVTWRGQIAFCTAQVIGELQGDGCSISVLKPCDYQGTYPDRVEVEELNEKEKV